MIRSALSYPSKKNLVLQCLRRMSSLVSTSVSEVHPGVAHVTMHSPPVNSLSLSFCQELSQNLQVIHKDKSIDIILLQSDIPGIFSAGLDIKEFTQPKERLMEFWTAFQQLYIDLYGASQTTIACMEGSAPAAGCMLALSCDYRVMTSNTKAKIGLNESLLGIAAPPWLAQQMMDTVGSRVAELSLWRGTLYAPEQALAIGLVDELHENPRERALELAVAEFQKIPRQARAASKTLTRQKRLKHFHQERQADLEHFVNFITQDAVQTQLRGYLQQLAAKKNKK
ncbi:3,2-trans-enoyl-CoA isomerase, mitochondrial [Fistulifera solaris]|uniref:Enoyl-CoA delta isomerase 1, mitochondrial n=1 Tax=Fistulifera solaris TaxID=1519565 RepID=A0A1Z5KET7_FISSO|nr:3,2-trans-enoyl-CoA isomerase, mitochondrial [Fistulifera solaris]|eukprot:GAX24759.1 3,2-trans-enoyl-CoA isomerase, mitochondrial [Fistulifera solaris]